MANLLQQIQQHAAILPLQLQAELLNYVIYLEFKARGNVCSVPTPQRRERLQQALTQAALLNPFSDVLDPVLWQKEQRRDRLLPDRESENVN